MTARDSPDPAMTERDSPGPASAGRDSPDPASTDRAVSVALNYILALAISTVLVTGLIVAGGSFVEDTRERVIENELTVIGNHLAGNMEQVDRFAAASEGETVAHINQTFQRQTTGTPYFVELEDGTPSQIVLNATEVDISVRVNTTVDTDLNESSFAVGGTISIRYNETSDELVMDNA